MQRDFHTHILVYKELTRILVLVFTNLKMMNDSSKRHSQFLSLIFILNHSVLSRSNLKLHQTFEVKNIFKQEKIMLQLTFNPGLTLTAFRTSSK